MTQGVLLLCLLALGSAFYLPGVLPRDFDDGEPVELKVNMLDSVKTQLPYDFYSLDFCAPTIIEQAAENLGEHLSGDDIQNSAYEIYMQQTDACKILCRKSYDEAKLKEFEERIREDYKVNWIIDNMPAATRYYTATDDDKQTDFREGDNKYTEHYLKGFDLGFTDDKAAYLNNHHRLTVFTHEDPASFEGFRIVGFEVEAYSVAHQVNGEWKGASSKLTTCTALSRVSKQSPPLAVSGVNKLDVIWTYDVQWRASPIKWASRWDLYLKMTDSQIHWFSIINSIMVVLFLSGLVAMIMMRTLYRDLQKYNSDKELTDEEQQEKYEEETGWKLVHGDVFRPPRCGGLFSVLVGTGVQIIAGTVLLLTFALFGFLSPANRGGLMTAMLLLFVFMGMLAGYFSTRIYKMFKLTNWKSNTLLTAMLFPGICFGTFFILNLFVWGQKSSGAVPFLTLVALLVLWMGISVPLVYLGAYMAVRRPAVEPPVRVNNIPREIPEVPWHRQALFSILAGGIIPFAAVFIEVFFIMSSVWLHQFYYVFGFVFLVFIILMITSAEIAIVMNYFHLCTEDYHWWWRSLFTPGASAMYLFLYSIFYFVTKLDVQGFVPTLLFFGYMGLASLVFFLLTGTVGYFATYQFVRSIYGAVKVD